MSTENEVNETSNNEEVTESSYEIKSWEELELDTNILRGIYAYGFEKPSPIQQKAIKPIMMGRDIVAQAQSGTGKTATFSIGALSIVDMEKNATQVLILSPTRELTSQTSKVINSLGGMVVKRSHCVFKQYLAVRHTMKNPVFQIKIHLILFVDVQVVFMICCAGTKSQPRLLNLLSLMKQMKCYRQDLKNKCIIYFNILTVKFK